MEEKNLPPLRTPEQRKEAMAKAIHTRRERAAFKAACKAGNIPPEVAIEGKLHYSSWEKDGQKRSKLEVIVDEIEVMVRREGQTQAQPQQSLAETVPMQPRAQAAPQWNAQQAYAAVPQSEFYDEDVPF